MRHFLRVGNNQIQHGYIVSSKNFASAFEDDPRSKQWQSLSVNAFYLSNRH